MSNIDTREIKILSDILALVLEEEEGQSHAALSALKARARKNGTTGGALKNLFATIIVDPPKPTRRRSTAGNKADLGEENANLRRHVQVLTSNLQTMGVHLRSAEAQSLAPQREMFQVRQSHAEVGALLEVETQGRSRSMMMVYIALFAGIVLGVAAAQLYHAFSFAPVIDSASYLNEPFNNARPS
ncbi:MAG: hypothetical protein AAYR33_01290 [Acetobacteraceae bacterium]